MERFVYLDGKFWDRVSNDPEEIAKALQAQIVSITQFDSNLLGQCELVKLTTLETKEVQNANL